MRSTPPVGSRVTRCTTVDTWMSYSWEHGVQVDEIADLHALRVETRNSTYDIAVVSGRTGEVLVRGGRYFPDWTPAVFLGCSLGGALLKCNGVHVGLRLEFSLAGRRIITSPVYAVSRGAAIPADAPAS